MKIKYNLLFFVDKEGNRDTGYKPDGKLRLRIRYESGKVDFNVGFRVDLSKWITESQRCKSGTSHGKKKISASEINAEIQRLETVANELFKTYEVEEHVPTINEFRGAFNSTIGKTKIKGIKSAEAEPAQDTFFIRLLEFTREGKQSGWADGTCKKFKAVEKHLRGFDKDLAFDELDESRLMEYVEYLREKGMRNTTIGKQLGILKWFLRWAFKKGYTTNSAFNQFRPKLKSISKKVIFLTWEELTKLREYKIPESKQYLERVRDAFLFQCYTSLRYSDVFNLRRSDINGDRIEVTTVKTDDSLVIELNNFSRAILAKYQDFHFANNKALPVISNQKMNQFLKELAELAGIDEPVRESYYIGGERIDEVTPKYALISTHAGRRTFICNSLAMGIPAQTVMKWTGHSDYSAMRPYIDVADNDRQTAMTAWDKKEETDTAKLLDGLKSLPKDKLAELLKTLEK